MPIRQLHMIYDNLNDALIYAEGFFDILNNKKDIEQSGHHRPAKVEGNFEISGVDFEVSADASKSPKVYSIKVPQVEGLTGKHAIYLVAEGPDLEEPKPRNPWERRQSNKPYGLFDLHGIGFTKEEICS